MTFLLTNRSQSFVLITLILVALTIGEMLFIAPIVNAYTGTLSKCKELGITSAFEYRTASDSSPYYKADSDLFIYSDSFRIFGDIIVVNNNSEQPVVHFSNFLRRKYNINDDRITYYWNGNTGVMVVGEDIPSLKLFASDESILSSDIIVVEGLYDYIITSSREAYETFDDNWSGLAWGNSILTTMSMFSLVFFVCIAIYVIVRTVILTYLCKLLEKLGLMDVGGYWNRLERVGVSSGRIRLHYFIEIMLLNLIPIVLIVFIGLFYSFFSVIMLMFSVLDLFSVLFILKRLRRYNYETR